MTIQERLSKFVVVEPDRQERKPSEHGGVEMVTLWRVVLVRGTDRLTLVCLSELPACEAYANRLKQTYLSPLLVEVQTLEQEACLAAVAARSFRR